MVVVGAGVTGCAAALALAEAGLRVRLHDAREVAGGASGRNGGFALRGGAAPYDVTAETIGRETGAPALAADRGGARPPRSRSRATPCGARAASASPPTTKRREALRIEFDLLREDGFAASWVDEPLDGRFRAAIFHPGDAALQPARWVRRLAVLAAEAGRRDPGARAASTSLEDVDAAQVLVATDGYPSGLLGRLEGLIVPTRGQMIATEPLDERIFECPHYGRHGFDYWQQTPDGRILAGGFRDFALESEFTAEEQTTPQIQDALETFVAELVGRPVSVEHRWAGIFGLVLDFLPVVGRVPGEDRVWVAGGYSGHGNVLGLLCGELVAQAMLGREAPELAWFDPERLL